MGKRRIEELRADELLVDHTVNRDEPPKATVDALVKRWRRESTSVLTASQRGDGIYLLDGQTRRLAALKCDPTFRFVVEVHDDLTMAEEIDLFEHLNKNRRQVAAIDLLRLRVTRGREPYATIGIQLARRGLRLGNPGRGASPTSIASATPIERLAAYPRGMRIIGDVLDTVMLAYPTEETRWRGGFLGGVVFAFIAADRVRLSVSHERMARVLQINLPRHWETKARDKMGTARGPGTASIASSVGRMMIEKYNTRLVERNRIPLSRVRTYDDGEVEEL